MKAYKNIVLWSSFIFLSALTSKSQLLNPLNKFRPLGMNVEAGAGLDFKSGNAPNFFANFGASLRLWNVVVYRPNIYFGAKVKNENYKTDNSVKWLHEVCLHPFRLGKKGDEAFTYLGFYGALDQNVRNYSFDEVNLYDAETGAAVREQYNSDYTKGKVAFQYALPFYKVGLSLYAYKQSSVKTRKTVFDETGGYAANIYLFYSIPTQAVKDTIIATQSYFNVNVPSNYVISNARSFTRGVGFGVHLISSQLINIRLEFGTRPSLHLQSDKSLFGKGGYIVMNFNIRLI
jgi:hypothetical protein